VNQSIIDDQIINQPLIRNHENPIKRFTHPWLTLSISFW